MIQLTQSEFLKKLWELQTTTKFLDLNQVVELILTVSPNKKGPQLRSFLFTLKFLIKPYIHEAREACGNSA
jgi:hypothetical protein